MTRVDIYIYIYIMIITHIYIYVLFFVDCDSDNTESRKGASRFRGKRSTALKPRSLATQTLMQARDTPEVP